MEKAKRSQYVQAVQDAEAEWDADIQESELAGMSEAEQLAHMAEKPRKRIDGRPVGSDHRRGKGLTISQHRFVAGVIRGESLRKAYREAFQNNTGSDASISASANKLMKDPRVVRALDEAWGQTVEHLIEDVVASKRYVLKGLLALSKAGKQEGTQLRALELMGKACGLFTPMEVQDKAPVTADQLKRELAGHLKLLKGQLSSVEDVQITSMRVNAERVNDAVRVAGDA
jgi:hypothetical protein